MLLEYATAAFLVGLLGAGHCFAMCGGIVSMLCGGTRARSLGRPNLALILGYHAGRVSSYAAAGVIAGALGSLAWLAEGMFPVQRVLYAVAALVLLATGFYLLGFAALIAPLEQLGARLWSRIAPIATKFAPARSVGQAVTLGMLWGWVPCGLVYGALAIAVSTASPITGGLTMLAFGAGTLPALLVASAMAAKIGAFIKHRVVRALAGTAIVTFGVIGLVHAVHAAS